MTPKHIVVLTDFSPASEVATRYAASLAELLQARLVLLHLYYEPLLAPEMAMVSVQVAYQTQAQAARALHELAQQLSVPATTEVIGETLSAAIADAVERYQPLMLVMGRAHTESFLDRLVSNQALPLLHAAHYPVLVVPEELTASELPHRRVLVAADEHPFRLTLPAKATRQLFRALHATATVVHVTPDSGRAGSQAPAALEAVRQTGVFGELVNNSLYEVRDEAPAEGILHAVADTQAELVVMLARPHSFLGSLFHRSVTARVMDQSPVPVLLLPTEA
jgi:nucleotide-binding universal stress UspA family protein